MKQVSFLRQAAGFALTTFGGTIMHFLYDWTGGSILAAPFSGVNNLAVENLTDHFDMTAANLQDLR